MVQEDEYDKCIIQEKIKKILASKDPDDVSDLLQWHVRGGAICCYAIVILYGQILFSVIRHVYKYSGILMLILLVLVIAFNSLSVAWVDSNACTDTDFYGMAIVLNTILYLCALLIFIASVTIALIGLCTQGSDDHKVAVSNENRKGATPTPNSSNGLEHAKLTKAGKFSF
jgi:hypothetical protein